MNTTNKKIGLNIANLLRIHDITQSKLARDLTIDKSRVSRYINGKEEISKTNLEQIAAYFNESVENLMYGDYSYLCGEKVNPEVLYRKFSELFPLFVTDKAQSNPHFLAAYNEQRKMYSRIINIDKSFIDCDIDMIYDEYQKAMEDKSIQSETIANLLSMSFAFIIFMKGMTINTMDYNTLPLEARKYIDQNGGKKKHNNRNGDIQEADYDFQELIRDPGFIDELIDYYLLIKKKPGWENLVDYYICLQYLWGAMPNSFSNLQNHSIGQELLIIQALSGNEYADKYISALFIK